MQNKYNQGCVNHNKSITTKILTPKKQPKDLSCNMGQIIVRLTRFSLRIQIVALPNSSHLLVFIKHPPPHLSCFCYRLIVTKIKLHIKKYNNLDIYIICNIIMALIY